MEEEQGQTQVQSAQQTSEEKPKQEGSGAYTLQHDRPNCIGCAACEAVAARRPGGAAGGPGR